MRGGGLPAPKLGGEQEDFRLAGHTGRKYIAYRAKGVSWRTSWYGASPEEETISAGKRSVGLLESLEFSSQIEP